MKKIITTYLILLSMTVIAQDLKNKVTIYQDGKEFEVKEDIIPIVLKNKKFSIRFLGRTINDLPDSEPIRFSIYK